MAQARSARAMKTRKEKRGSNMDQDQVTGMVFVDFRTASYGPSFFLRFMAQARSARAMKTKKEKRGSNMDQDQVTGMVFVDFRKAFDVAIKF